MLVHDCRRLFWTTIPVARGRILEGDGLTIRETEEPWGVGSGIAVRVAPATALGIGLWGPPREVDEETALLEALGGAHADADELPIWADDYVRPPTIARVDVRIPSLALLAFWVFLWTVVAAWAG